MTKSMKKPAFPRMESVARIGSIPLVETGIGISGQLYTRIRESNPLFRWSLSTAESSFLATVDYALPAVTLLEGPINTIDRILCKSLDAVEQRVPSVYLPPQMMYSNTKDYMTSTFVKPVLRRTNSVKQFGSAVLDSRVTALAADTLDKALNKADEYVDKILPPGSQDVVDGPEDAEGTVVSGEGGRARAAHTIQHGARLRRKLQRRLTRQALLEAKAIKEQINVVVYMAELVAKDPKQAWAKACELYESLSGPEPENQARPDTVEQLLVMLARESARRVIHLIRFTATDLPKNLKSGVHIAAQHLLQAADALIKTTHLEGAKESVNRELQYVKLRLQILLAELQDKSKNLLENVAIAVAGNEEREKIQTASGFNSNNKSPSFNNSINGVNYINQ